MSKVFHISDDTHALVSEYCKKMGYNVKEFTTYILSNAVANKVTLQDKVTTGITQLLNLRKQEVAAVKQYQVEQYNIIPPPEVTTSVVLKKGVNKDPGDVVYVNEIEDVWTRKPFWTDKNDRNRRGY